MKLPFYWVDAFASAVFRGNPAGVIPLDSWLEDGLMRKIAFENGLAETAFFVRTGPAQFDLRWFTPMAEVDLCGHATLATAYVVFNELAQPGETITFNSRSGPLTVLRKGSTLLELNFPALTTTEVKDVEILNAVTAALGDKPQWLGRTPFDLMALLANQKAVEKVCPELPKVAALGGRGLIVTAAGDAGADFVSRFFAPQVGIPEDPVTGSAHCALVPFWAQRKGAKSFKALQVSPRTGELQCALDANRVRMAGNAVLYLRGEIQI